MGFDIPFIHPPYVSDVFARLDRAVNSRRMMPIAGYHGAGRRRLLTEWATEAQTQVQPDQYPAGWMVHAVRQAQQGLPKKHRIARSRK